MVSDENDKPPLKTTEVPQNSGADAAKADGGADGGGTNGGGANGDDEVMALTPKDDIMSSPLFILVTLMAYIAECGGRDIPMEQKAEFVTILRKHVRKEDITEHELHLMVRDGFKQTLRVEYRTYLDKVAPKLSLGQRLSIIANLYNMMMVDGELLDGEETRIDLCRRVFGLDPDVTRQIRRILLLKNDTSVFLDPGHPGNDPGFHFKINLS